MDSNKREDKHSNDTTSPSSVSPQQKIQPPALETSTMSKAQGTSIDSPLFVPDERAVRQQPTPSSTPDPSDITKAARTMTDSGPVITADALTKAAVDTSSRENTGHLSGTKRKLNFLSFSRADKSNPYQILYISRDADMSTIRSAFVRLAKTAHPKLPKNAKSGNARKAFKIIVKAARTLKVDDAVIDALESWNGTAVDIDVSGKPEVLPEAMDATFNRL